MSAPDRLASRGLRVVLTLAAVLALGTWMLQALAQQVPQRGESEWPATPRPGPVLAQDDGNNDDANGDEVATLKPPIGVVAEVHERSVDLAWVPHPESTVQAEAFDVLYWPDSPAGFALRKRLYETPQPGRAARIEGLTSGTEYLISVRAASQRVLDLERRGDYSLSKLSEPVRIHTAPNPELVLLAATRGREPRAAFRLDYTDLDSGELHSFPLVTYVGEEIRRRVEVHGEERMLAPGYELVRTLRVPYRPFANEAQERGWHELELANGDSPRDELDDTPFELRLPHRVEPRPPASRTREAALLRNLATEEERLLLAEPPWH